MSLYNSETFEWGRACTSYQKNGSLVRARLISGGISQLEELNVILGAVAQSCTARTCRKTMVSRQYIVSITIGYLVISMPDVGCMSLSGSLSLLVTVQRAEIQRNASPWSLSNFL